LIGFSIGIDQGIGIDFIAIDDRRSVLLGTKMGIWVYDQVMFRIGIVLIVLPQIIQPGILGIVVVAVDRKNRNIYLGKIIFERGDFLPIFIK